MLPFALTATELLPPHSAQVKLFAAKLPSVLTTADSLPNSASSSENLHGAAAEGAHNISIRHRREGTWEVLFDADRAASNTLGMVEDKPSNELSF